jgi:hypothetical protein
MQTDSLLTAVARVEVLLSLGRFLALLLKTNLRADVSQPACHVIMNRDVIDTHATTVFKMWYENEVLFTPVLSPHLPVIPILS